MKKILIAGTGKIGSLIAGLLADTKDYHISVIDQNFNGADYQRISNRVNLTEIQQDIYNTEKMHKLLASQGFAAIISSLPFYCNKQIAEYSKEFSTHYFDLTEDIKITKEIQQLASNSKCAFVPQCGLAPGFIGIAAYHLMEAFDKVETVKMRVGALPVNSNNALQYCLTWSTEGLINEYANECQGLEHGKIVSLRPLQGLETIKIDGVTYEAFNTSGGIGSLAEVCQGKVSEMNYKTIRYPGHCERMSLLMDALKLKDDPKTLKQILEHAIPKTYQDVVIIYVSVVGRIGGELVEQNTVKKVYPQRLLGHQWSAIQVTTASSLCAVLDMVLENPNVYQGFIGQDRFDLNTFLKNRFGKRYLNSD